MNANFENSMVSGPVMLSGPKIPAPADSEAPFSSVMLQSCLAGVRRQLKAAALKWREDDEHVHSLRVSLRRLLAGMDLLPDCIRECKDSIWLRKRLKALLKATSDARDLDVLLQTQKLLKGKAGDALRKCWKKQRKKCQTKLIAFYRGLIEEKQLRRHSRALLESLEESTAGAAVADFNLIRQESLTGLRDMSRQLVEVIPSQTDAAAVHRFRLAVKRIRYTLELLKDRSPEVVPPAFLLLLAEIQKKLGDLQDQTVAMHALKQFVRSGDSKSGSRKLKAMLNSRQLALTSRIQQMVLWLQSEVKPRLKEFLVTPSESIPAAIEQAPFGIS